MGQGIRKKGIYIHTGSDTVFSGVNKKIKNQLRTFSVYFDMDEVIIYKKPTDLLKSIGYRLPGGSFGRDYESAKCSIEELEPVDFFYIRDTAWDYRLFEFMSWIRRTHPKSKILLEIPTYPYAKELLNSPTMWPWFFKDALYKRKAKRCIDHVVTFSDDETIYGVKTIIVKNGIIVDDYINDHDEKHDPEDDLRINLLAVAQFQASHGYERIIRGLYRYYQNEGSRDIRIDMVGTGPELIAYKKLVDQYGLSDHILFHGSVFGDELLEYYSKADIGLGCFGLYKRGITRSSALKTREYLACGLPVVSGCMEDAFEHDKGADFYLEYPNDQSDISIQRIIDFYDKLRGKSDNTSLKKQIREYAKNHLDMSIVMQPIVNYVME